MAQLTNYKLIRFSFPFKCCGSLQIENSAFVVDSWLKYGANKYPDEGQKDDQFSNDLVCDFGFISEICRDVL